MLLAAYMQVMDLAAMVGLTARDELEFDHLGDGTLRLRTVREGPRESTLLTLPSDLGPLRPNADLSDQSSSRPSMTSISKSSARVKLSPRKVRASS